MPNLLDRASIVLTPTAYDDGKVLCAKPIDGSGDFDFSRNSAATRVNAQGLVEDVQIISGNKITNGDFSQLGSQEITNGSFSQQGTEQILDGSFANGDANWNRENGVFTISGGVANGNGANGSSEELSQNLTQNLTAGKTYKVVFELLNYVSGSVQFVLTSGGSSFGTSRSVDGTFTQYVVVLGDNNKIKFRGANFNGSITSISLVEVGQDWTSGTGWSIGEDKAVCDGTQTGNSGLVQQGGINGATINFVVGKTYKVNFDVVVTSGVITNIEVASGVDGNSITASGNHTTFITAVSTNNRFTILANPSFIGSVTNVSVKEVGQDWLIEAAWTIGDGVANGNGANGSNEELVQQNSLTVGKTYSMTYEVKNYVSGGVRIRKPNGTNRTANGVYTEILLSTSLAIIFKGSNFNGSITNIIAKEITDDTNLPRINYEGFSYQDALGSEEIVNGDFATDDISGWSGAGSRVVDNGRLKISETTQNFSQAIYSGLDTSKKYKTTFTITRGTQNPIVYGTENGNIVIFESGTYTYILENTNKFYVGTNGDNDVWYIDNVSVKEYSGQEVVPDSGCGSWLWENQSTNLLPVSEDFNRSNWSKVGTTVSASNENSPSGELTAYKMTTTSTSQPRIEEGVSVPSTNTIFTFSVFVKKVNTKYIALSRFSGSQSAIFDLDTKAVISSTMENAIIKDFGNGWFKISATNTVLSTDSFNIWKINGTNGSSLATGVIGDETLIWGAQLEKQSFATSYIPTDGQASGVTRNRDLCTGGGSAASISSTSGVLYAEISGFLSDSDTNDSIAIAGTSSNRLYIYRSSSDNKYGFAVFSNGSLQCNIKTAVVDFSVNVKIAAKYKLNDFALYLNGTKVATDSSGDTPIGLNSLQFNAGVSGPGINSFFGKTKCLAVWKEALTDLELQELTTI